MRGIFITFEGTEGSGKSSQMNRLARRLARKGYQVIQTREPGGTVTGERIRRVLLSTKSKHLDPRAELFLYLASRTQHLEEVILPALRAGKIVLCDRFTDATLAYQGFGRRLDMRFTRQAVEFAAKRIQPDLTLLLDMDVRTGLTRVKGRGRRNRIDLERLEFHKRVRKGYLWLAKNQNRRIRVLDASREMRPVSRDIEVITDKFLQRYKGIRFGKGIV